MCSFHELRMKFSCWKLLNEFGQLKNCTNVNRTKSRISNDFHHVHASSHYQLSLVAGRRGCWSLREAIIIIIIYIHSSNDISRKTLDINYSLRNDYKSTGTTHSNWVIQRSGVDEIDQSSMIFHNTAPICCCFIFLLVVYEESMNTKSNRVFTNDIHTLTHTLFHVINEISNTIRRFCVFSHSLVTIIKTMV